MSRRSTWPVLLVAFLSGSAFLLAPAAFRSGIRAEAPANPPRNGDAAAQKAPPPELLADIAHRYVGTASCAASNCHGRPGPRQPAGAEYTIWIEEDPHARAYSVLFNEQSRQMAARLSLAAAHEADLCLDCHSINARPDALADHHRFTRFDGVGCEACHGPAEHWLEPHKRRDWNLRTAQDKALLGFRNTDDLLVRGRVCVDCHVGEGRRDVNHDLIAAGHPRLNFELSAFHALLPKHWSVSEDRRQHAPSLEGKLWEVGQFVSAEAAARLTAERAGDRRHVWPEFAEYDCFACHHDLSVGPSAGESWRQSQGFPGRTAGELPWETWYLTALPLLDSRLENAESLRADVRRVQTIMDGLVPDRDEAATAAGSLADRLGQIASRIDNRPANPAELRATFLRLVRDAETPTRTWDEATQQWLAGVALYQGLLEATGRPILAPPDAQVIPEAFQRIREQLQFPQEDGKTYSSPKHYSTAVAESIATEWGRIRQRLERP